MGALPPQGKQKNKAYRSTGPARLINNNLARQPREVPGQQTGSLKVKIARGSAPSLLQGPLVLLSLHMALHYSLGSLEHPGTE